MTNLFKTFRENLVFVLQFLGITVALFVLALLLEKLAQKRSGVHGKLLTVRKMALIAMFSAIATVLMLFEIPLPFAPPFYKVDLSELPIMIGALALGPAAGVVMEFLKVLLNLLLNGTTTVFVGEFANFVVGCSLIIPASAIYAFWRKKKGAAAGLIVGTLVLTAFGTALNAIYLLPAFSELYGMPMDMLLAMGEEVNPLVKSGDIVSFVVACVAPMNVIKGTAVSVITLFIYKPLSPILKVVYKN